MKWGDLQVRHKYKIRMGRATGKMKCKKLGTERTQEELGEHHARTARDFKLLLEFAERRYDGVVWCYCDANIVFNDLLTAHHEMCDQRKKVINQHFHSRVMMHDALGFLLSLDTARGDTRAPGDWHRGSRSPVSRARHMTLFINTISVIALTDQFPAEVRDLVSRLTTPEKQAELIKNAEIVMPKIAGG